jgi:ubiquinone/menaquinone biosynthesis C-methylase UbiE
MTFYARYVLPRIIDVVMRNRESTRLRSSWIPRATGNVLEVGIGSGLNLPFYSSEVRCVFGVDPSLELQSMARRRAAALPIRVEYLSHSAEEPLPLDDRSIDTVVTTWTLCSIPKVRRALEQMARVLKPGGQLIFIEHGLAPDRSVAGWQNRITPIWRRIGGGCHLNKKIDELIERAGFQIRELKASYLPGPRPMSYTYEGIASHAPHGETGRG